MKATRQPLAATAIDGARKIGPINIDVDANKITSQPPTPIQLAPRDIWIDGRYQRNLSARSIRLIAKIVSGWDWTKYKPPVVTLDSSGRYMAVDGQHTLIAASMHPDISTVPCSLVEIGATSDQAKAFIGHNRDRIAVPPLDLWHANIQAGDENCIAVSQIFVEHGIEVVRSGASNALLAVNQTMAAHSAVELYVRLGTDRFTALIAFIADCGFTPIRIDHFHAVSHLLYPANPSDVVLVEPVKMLALIRSFNHIESLAEARKIAATYGKMPIWRALAQYYRLAYARAYPRPQPVKS